MLLRQLNLFEISDDGFKTHEYHMRQYFDEIVWVTQNRTRNRGDCNSSLKQGLEISLSRDQSDKALFYVPRVFIHNAPGTQT